MKTIDDFKKFYDREYFKFVDEYNDSYIKFNSDSQKKITLFLMICILLFIVLYFVFKIYSYSFFINLLYFLLYSTIVIVVKQKLNRYFLRVISTQINKLIFKDIFNYIVDNKDRKFSPDKRISKDYFKKSMLFNLDKLDYNGDNFSSFYYNDERIVFSDIYIYDYKYKFLVDTIYKEGKYYKRTIKRKIPKQIYRGLYIELPFHKDNNKFIYVISNDFKHIVKNRINSFLSYYGERVNLENIDFEEQYNVYCEDQIQARYILSLSLMEKIAKINEEFNYSKCFVFRPDGKVSLFIENYTIDKVLNSDIGLENGKISYKYLTKCFENLNSIIKLYNILNDK